MERSIRINIISPFYRWENLATLVTHLKKFNIKWYPIVETDHELMKLMELTAKEDWIFPIKTDVPDGYDKCYYKLNGFIESGKVREDEYYASLCDDDMYEDNIFEFLKNISNDLVVVSMKRGDAIPREATGVRAHPTDTLYAERENMKVGRVSHEQFFIKGKLFKTLHYQNIYYADGLMGEFLVKNVQDIQYIKDAFVLFNYLEPGRYL